MATGTVEWFNTDRRTGQSSADNLKPPDVANDLSCRHPIRSGWEGDVEPGDVAVSLAERIEIASPVIRPTYSTKPAFLSPSTTVSKSAGFL
jgi:hypothetical protein